MTYYDELTRAMEMIAADPRAIFLGQSIVAGGTGMTKSFERIPREKLIEMPVAEDMQLGMATGLALGGALAVTVYPRINFLLLAMSQLVLHLDALPQFSRYRPRVIIRTAVATPVPLDPGPQHLGDYSYALSLMLRKVKVVPLHSPDQIVPAYKRAMWGGGSTLLIEYIARYQDIITWTAEEGGNVGQKV